MSLGHIPVHDMADQLGVHRATVTRWMEDKGPVKRAYLKQWAAITGVDYCWLAEGHTEPDDGEDEPPPGTPLHRPQRQLVSA